MAQMQVADKLCSKCKRDLPDEMYARHGAGRRPDCKDCRKNVRKAWYEKNKAIQQAKNRAWQIANPDVYRSQNKATKAKRAEHYAKIQRAWVVANPDKVREKTARYHASHPEVARTNNRNRWALKKAAVGKHTRDDIAELHRLQRGKCACCKTKLDAYHVDHITSLAWGGSNDKTNLQLLCVACNCSKGAKHPVDFAQSRGYLI